MTVLVVLQWVLCSREYEFDHVVNRCVLGISGSFLNVADTVGSPRRES